MVYFNNASAQQLRDAGKHVGKKVKCWSNRADYRTHIFTGKLIEIRGNEFHYSVENVSVHRERDNIAEREYTNPEITYAYEIMESIIEKDKKGNFLLDFS